MAENAKSKISDRELVRQAYEMPGEMGPQYSYFYPYSLGNQAYLWMQGAREIIGKYRDWLNVGRHVLSGGKAYEIFRPNLIKVTSDEGLEEEVLAGWLRSRCIFTLSQTEGEALPPIQMPRWDLANALGKLGVREVPFTSTDGNLQGYAVGLEFAVSPIAHNRLKTVFHELGHMVLGHTMLTLEEGETYHRGLREAEAEITALVCMRHVGLLDDETASHGRAYVQYWLDGSEFPDSSARRVLKAAGAILRAGQQVASSHVALARAPDRESPSHLSQTM